MLISLTWIRDYVDLPDDFDPRELAERFTRVAAEVDGIEPIRVGAEGLVGARVVEVIELPDSGSRRLARLDVGGRTVQTVTAAPTLPVGAGVVYAPTGAHVASLGTISAARVAGQKCEGMILPGESIGVTMAVQEAIFLPPGVEPGQPLPPELFDDWVMEVDNKSITHRPDLWGHYGIAREIAAIIKSPLKPYPVASREELSSNKLPEIAIQIDDPEACPRYSAIRLEGVPTQPSPLWMQLRLGRVGLRPISGLVDLTNYIMTDLGQPMHAFDAAKVDRIEVAWADDGELFTALDGIERKLLATDLIIQCKGHSLALAGVMGGRETEVTDTTTSLLLESANFNGAAIRRTARRLALRSDASARFEKSLDPAHTVLGIQRFLELARPMYPALKVTARLSDGYPLQRGRVTVAVQANHASRILGRTVSRNEAAALLSPLGFDVRGDDVTWSVHVPSFRATGDVSIEADVIEEIARRAGYDNVEPRLPHTTVRNFPMNAMHELERATLRYFAGVCGFNEIHGYLWYDSSWIARLGHNPGGCIEVRNPAAQGQHRLRKSLLPGLLTALTRNRFYFPSLSLMEIGSVFIPGRAGREDCEHRHAGFVVARRGRKVEAQLDQALKADLFGWAWERFGEACLFQAVSPDADRLWEHRTRTASILLGSDPIGRVSVVDLPLRLAMDEHLGAWSIAWAEVWLESLADRQQKPEKPGTIPPYPLVELDFSVVVDKTTQFASVVEAVRAFSHPLLKQVRFITSYEGESIGNDQRSLTFRTIIGDDTRTLVDNDTNAFRAAFGKHLTAKGYRLRSA